MMSVSQSIVTCFALTILFHTLSIKAAVVPLEGNETDSKVSELLHKMSLEEKIGQMTQITLEVISESSHGSPSNHAIDSQKLESAVLDHHVGSILNIVSSGYSVQHWQDLIQQIQEVAVHRTLNHIPILYGIDAAHGASFTLGATLFPQPIAMAATWNQDLVNQEGRITALEIRASGIPWNFSPVVDVGRQPLWPRFWETYGEDVYLTSTLGASYIQGHQGNDFSQPTTAATCLKHYMGYSYPLSGNDRTPAWLSERILREYFLPPFEAGIKAGAAAIMVNSSEVDGIPVHSNYHLLTEILRDELHFKGFTVSDWEDIKRLYTRDKVAASPEAAVQMAVMAGIDMSMVPDDYSFYDILLKLVRENKVPMTRIDEAVSRILRAKYQIGLFDRPYPESSLMDRVASPESTQANLKSAREAITLLKNSGNILPLSKASQVLVTGPMANSLSTLNGGWTITWQGNDESLYPKDKMTILQAIQSKIGDENVSYLPGADPQSSLEISSVIEAAQNSDVIILCLGEKPYAETPGNIDDLTLDEVQLNYAEELIKTGKPIILVLVEGRPRVISKIADRMQGVLLAYLPGMEGGRAIADVLFGDVNPSGKLPFSYPRHPNSIVPYDHLPMEEEEGNSYNPQFPFGFGLSYTRFKYSDLSVSPTPIQQGQNIDVSVTVTNSGNRAGKEVVQLFLNQSYASVSRPVRQIKGFTKIELLPGDSQRVHFTLTPADLSFIGRDNKRTVEPGEFTVMIDGLEGKFVVR